MSIQNDQIKQNYHLSINFNCIKDAIINDIKLIKSEDLSYNSYRNKISQNLHQIGILGKRNNGKTFITQKLSEVNLSQGLDQNTKGLNILFTNQFRIIDTQGLGDVLNNFQPYQQNVQQIKDLEKQDKYDEKLKLQRGQNEIITEILDNQKQDFLKQLGTEDIIQSFIIKTSDVVILVLTQIDLDNLKIIEKIKKLQFMQGSGKLIIIHNYKNLYDFKQLKTIINNDILPNFCIEEFDISQFSEDSNKKIEPLKDIGDVMQNSSALYRAYHYFLLNDDICPKFNQKTIDSIFSNVSHITKQKTELNFFQIFNDYLNKNIYKYINLKAILAQKRSAGQQFDFKFKYDEEKNIIYSPDLKKDIDNIIFLEIQRDYLGISNDSQSGKDFIPQYQVYKSDSMCVVDIQIPYLQFLKPYKLENGKTQIVKYLITHDKNESRNMRFLVVEGQHDEEKIKDHFQQKFYGLNIQQCDLRFKNNDTSIKIGSFKVKIPISDIYEQCIQSGIVLETSETGNLYIKIPIDINNEEEQSYIG